MPTPDTIRCDKCGFKTSSRSMWGRFKYMLPDGTEAWAERQTGWCQGCADIRPVEVIPNLDRVKKRLAEAEARLTGIQRSLLRKRLASGKHEMAQLSTEIDDLRRTVQFVQLREGPSRCLICGDREIIYLTLPDPDTGQEVETGFRHPECGGMLRIRMSDVHLSVNLVQRIYDVEGNLLDER